MPRRKTGEAKLGQVGENWLSLRPGSPVYQRTFYDRSTKQTRRVSLGTSDLQEAKEKLIGYAAVNPVADQKDPSKVPLQNILVWYWENHARTLPSANAQQVALGYWSQFFDGDAVSDVTPSRVDHFIARLKALDHSPGYISRTLSVGRAALKRAQRYMIVSMVPFIHDNETAAHKRDKEPKGRELTMEEHRRLYDAQPSEHMRLFMDIMLHTVCRPAAALELTRGQIDFDRGIVYLNPRGRLQTKKNRATVPLTPTLRRILLAHDTKDRYVTYLGKPVKSVKKAWQRMVVRAGFVQEQEEGDEGPVVREPINSYSIRRTMAIAMRDADVPDMEMSLYLGHVLRGSSATTAIYAPFGPRYLKNAASAIEQYAQALGTSSCQDRVGGSTKNMVSLGNHKEKFVRVSIR